MVTHRRIHRHSREHVPVRLEVAGVPVVVLPATLVVDLASFALVDVVAQRDDETHVILGDHTIQHLCDAALTAAGFGV
jgi:hypothetical protein